MKGCWIAYSAGELAWISDRRGWPRKQLHAEFCRVWKRDDVSQANLTSLCKRKGWLTGRSGQFEKGCISHNKGKPMSPDTYAKCAGTMFRAGNRTGRANHVYKPIGTERISKDGYLERKIHDGLPMQSRWRAVHLIRWEAMNGEVPEGHALKCLDGDRRNTDPANWQAVPRTMLPYLSGGKHGFSYDQAADEVKPAILALAKVRMAAKAARDRGAT